MLALVLVWVLAAGGVFSIIGGITHIGPSSTEIAEEIGYTQSMFQWEVGFADIGIGVLGLGVIWWRDRWMDAAVVMLAISFGGDAIGHIMEYVSHDNTAPANTWAIPSDIVLTLVPVILLIVHRMQQRHGTRAVTASA